MTVPEFVARYLAERTVEEGECLVWIRAFSGNGQPRASIGKDRSLSVRRWVWEQRWGKRPGSKNIVPTCGNRQCVNPEHLTALTPSQKNRHYGSAGAYITEAVRISRQRTGRMVSSLTIEQVRAMRADRAAGGKVLDLATRYGVSKSTVSAICRGDRWRDDASPFAGLIAAVTRA